MLIYVSGPYSAPTRAGVEANIERARLTALALWDQGHTAICPHLNTAHFEEHVSIPKSSFLIGDLLILAKCDGILMLPDFRMSHGAIAEYHFALSCGIPAYVLSDGALNKL